MHEPTSKSKPNTGHWYLLRIHVKDRYVELVDSLEDETKLISRRHDAKRTVSYKCSDSYVAEQRHIVCDSFLLILEQQHILTINI